MAEKILIVDDVSKNIQILGNILSQKAYQIAYAQNGNQALDICKVQDFDLILLDIMMPGIDGYQVCNHLKNNPKTADIPIIFLTAKADMDSIIHGFETGGQDYITKPFNAAELLARVNNHLLIKRQKEQLKKMNLHLEDIVNERTNELENANRKLNIIDQAKSNFLSLISHEIRTPLNGVLGLTELLGGTNIDDKQKEYLQNLEDVSKRLFKFSDAALLITALKINSYRPDVLPVSLSNILVDATNEFRKSGSNLKISTVLPDKDLLVLVDSELIKTCILYIFENASKFAVPDPELNILLNVNVNGVKISFKDNGPGFSKEALESLFDLFSAGDILHSEGTGLGLATVKLILDAHEAKIDVCNIDSGGAEVVITLNKDSIDKRTIN